MKLRLFALLWLFPIASPATPVTAQQIAASDRAEIATRVAAFDRTMKEGRYGDTLDFVPARILSVIAKRSGVTPDMLRKAMTTQVAALSKEMTFVSFGMDLAAVTPDTTPDGKRSFLRIPTESVIAFPDGRKMCSRTTTLALQDEGRWYLVRIDNAQQLVFLREAYPEFTGVDFPAGTMTAVD